MKCEKCNERDANFFYTATINGDTTQRHLCSECAAEEGLDKVFRQQRDDVFSDFFGRRSLFDSFFADPFSLMDGFFPRRSLFGSLLPTMTLPRLRVAPPEQAKAEAAAPSETAAPAEQAAPSETEKAIPQDAGEEIRMLRELNALKHQLREAVYTEDFEKAIELRDKIRELEK